MSCHVMLCYAYMYSPLMNGLCWHLTHTCLSIILMYTVRTELSTLREMVTNLEEKAFLDKQASLVTSGTAGGDSTGRHGKSAASVGSQYRHPQQQQHFHPGQELKRMNEFSSQLKYLQTILNGGLHFNS